MQPLIDGDILVYEIGWAADTGWKAKRDWKEGDPPLDPPPFEYVAELLDNRIAEICGAVMATHHPIIYLTGKGNFREAIAKRKPYKGTRKEDGKPWHYANIWAYLQGAYNAIIIEGMEADDAMCIEQMKGVKAVDEFISDAEFLPMETIICTRDKDLRQCPGWHFGWELGNQPQFGPLLVEGWGYISLSDDNKKLRGVGEKFFYAQLIMGDPVDNIPGLPKSGPKAAFDIVGNTQTREEAFKAVLEAYRGFYGDSAKAEMLEQGQLLWMVRELDEEGKAVMWRFPDEDILN